MAHARRQRNPRREAAPPHSGISSQRHLLAVPERARHTASGENEIAAGPRESGGGDGAAARRSLGAGGGDGNGVGAPRFRRDGATDGGGVAGRAKDGVGKAGDARIAGAGRLRRCRDGT